MKFLPLRSAIPSVVVFLASTLCQAEKPKEEPAPNAAPPAAAVKAVSVEGALVMEAVPVEGNLVPAPEGGGIQGGGVIQIQGAEGLIGPVPPGALPEIQIMGDPNQIPVEEAKPVQGMIRVQAGAGGAGAGVLVVNGQVIMPGPGGVVLQQGDLGELVVTSNATSPTAGTVASQPMAAGMARLEFVNGDRLQGTMESLDGATGLLHWRHADSATPIPFKRSSVARITLPAPAVAGASTNQFGSTVVLTNGDFMRGRVTALDAESLTLETERCGTFRFERLMVESFSPDASAASLLYAGPFGLEGWTQQQMGGRKGSGWRFSRGAMSCTDNSAIARQVGAFPDKFRIAFKSEWTQYPGFQFFLVPRQNKEGGKFSMNGPVLMVSGSSLHWRRNMDNEAMARGRNAIAWNVNMENFRQGTGSLTLELFGNKATSDLSVAVNGKVIRNWNDPAFFKVNCEGIGFQSHTNADLRFSEIRVMAWDGVLPGTAGPKDAKPAMDQIHLANGDEIAGEVVSVNAGKLRLRSELTGEVDIPVQRVSMVRLAPESRERARRRKEDVRLVVADGAVLTATLDSVVAGKMKLSSENFGKAESPLDFLAGVDFNIYQRPGAATETEEP